MFMKQEFLDWRSSPITQELLKSISEGANGYVSTILNRRESNPLDDQFLKGIIQGLSLAAGWKPELIDDDGKKVEDKVDDEA